MRALQNAVGDYMIQSNKAPTVDGKIPLSGEYALIDFYASFTQGLKTFTFYPDFLEKLPRHHDEGVWRIDSGEVDMSQLKEEQEKIKVESSGLEQEKRALEVVLHQPEQTDATLETFKEFCSKVSYRLDDLTFEEKQKMLRLLNISGRIDNKRVYLSGCIPSWESEKFDYRTFEPDQLP